MTSDTARCAICFKPAKKNALSQSGPDWDAFKFTCPLCGTYRIRESPLLLLEQEPLKPNEVACAVGYRSENPHFDLTTDDDVRFLRLLRQPSIMDRAMKLLRALGKELLSISASYQMPTRPSQMGLIIDQTHPSYLRLLGASWSVNLDQVNYLLDKVLQKELGYAKFDTNISITPKGWVALEEAAKTEDPAHCFVAMSFNEIYKPVYLNAIAPAVQIAGYRPEQMEFVDHIESITDRMMADIRRARFLVVDLTEHRPNVYFEAGFAFGLGKPVVFLVREDHKNRVHFDIQQYSYISWKMDDLGDLRNRLAQRILGAIGLGPIAVMSA